MKAVYLFLVFAAGAVSAAAQGNVVINDPTQPPPKSKIGRAEEAIFKREALPAVRAKLASNTCKEAIDIAGVISGTFSRPESLQTVIFYQYCKTGNETGWMGLVLLQRGEVVGNFVSNSGVAANIVKLPDIDQNALEDFTLEYAGVFKAKHSDVAIDLMHFVDEVPVGIGSFTSEEYAEFSSDVWMVTAKPGTLPAFWRQKYSFATSQYKKVGGNLPFKLAKAVSAFTSVK